MSAAVADSGARGGGGGGSVTPGAAVAAAAEGTAGAIPGHPSNASLVNTGSAPRTSAHRKSSLLSVAAALPAAGDNENVKGGASMTLLAFLEKHIDTMPPAELIPRFNSLVAVVLAETSDSGLQDLLVDTYGWKGDFDLKLDVGTLLADLKKLTMKRSNIVSTLRASQVGVRNTIKSFAPDMLMYYTLEEKFHTQDRQLTPYSTFLDGVALLADISGFTRLSGTFCDRGKDGIDQLQQVVNGYLGQLVKIVYAYGGDVMKFAGDALVCVFLPGKFAGGGRQLTLADVCSNAIQCATELAECCTDTLTVHVAVSCGSICFAMLGGFGDQWECLTSGECFGHLSQCLDDAASKQTVVSSQLVDTLGPNYRKELNIEQLSSGNYRVISAAKMNSLVVRKMIKRRGEMLMKDSESRFSQFPNDPEFLTAIGYFVPTPVSVGLVSGSFDLLAELREVTTMFMSWDSYDEAEHRNLLSLQKYFYAAQKVLAESNGFVRQFLVDDKGCVLIACWGVPTASHPDNARRAVCAGSMISRELMRLGMKTSVGITTGNVFCGSVGSYVRREYAVIGDVVNLAARLMGKSKGGIYIDEATFSRLPPFIKVHLTKLDEIQVKGRVLPITPYSLKPGKRITLDDRGEGEKQIDALTIRSVCKIPLMEGLERISKSKEPVSLRFVMIEGKPGTGKIEVVDWLKATGPKMDVRVISVRMTAKDISRHYSMVAQLFRLLVREDIFDQPERQKVVVRHILREVYKNDKETAEKVAYPAMRIALGITAQLSDSAPTPKTEKPMHLPSKLVIQSLRDIFAYLLTEAPVTFVVEHAHYADQMSWNVVCNLSGAPSLALGVITMDTIEDLEALKNAPSAAMRDEIFSATDAPIALGRLKQVHRRIVKAETTTLVLMNDYSVEEVENLICNALDVAVCPDGLAAMVHQLSGGSPYWCREMALFIQSTGPDEFMRAMNPPGMEDYHSPVIKEVASEKELDGVGRSRVASRAPSAVNLVEDKEKDVKDESRRRSTGRRKNSSLYTKTPTPFATNTSPTHADASAPRLEAFSEVSTSNSALKAAADPSPKSSMLRLNGSTSEQKLNGNSPSSPTNTSLLITNGTGHVSSLQGSRDLMLQDTRKSATSSKLSVFIVCRFEKLSSEDQNVLRSASIIGHEFSRDILYGILSPKMRTHMFNSLQSLIKNQWIVETKAASDEYRFVHPLLYQTLYDLTPASEKARMHYSIASYVEDAYQGNPAHFAQLGHHYGMSKDCRPKALEYFVRAAVQCATGGLDSYDEVLDLVGQAGLYADAAFDYGAILGLVMDLREKVALIKRRMLQEGDSFSGEMRVADVAKGAASADKGTSWKVWLPWGSRTRVQDARKGSVGNVQDQLGLADLEIAKIAMTITGVSELLERYDAVESALTTAFDACVRDTNIGTMLEWQTPLLRKKREMMQYRGLPDPSAPPPASHTPENGSGRRRSKSKKRPELFGKIAHWGSVEVGGPSAAHHAKADSQNSNGSKGSKKDVAAALRSLVSTKAAGRDKAPRAPSVKPSQAPSSMAGGGPAGQTSQSFRRGLNAVSPAPARTPGPAAAGAAQAPSPAHAVNAARDGSGSPHKQAAVREATRPAADAASRGCTVA